MVYVWAWFLCEASIARVQRSQQVQRNRYFCFNTFQTIWWNCLPENKTTSLNRPHVKISFSFILKSWTILLHLFFCFSYSFFFFILFVQSFQTKLLRRKSLHKIIPNMEKVPYSLLSLNNNSSRHSLHLAFHTICSNSSPELHFLCIHAFFLLQIDSNAGHIMGNSSISSVCNDLNT